ncbi:3490_t:CDS:1, partial [Acaulospora colombiana]
DRMPSAKFVNPVNFSKIPANQPFTIQLKLKNLQAGFFTNAQTNYYAAPAEVNGDGVLIGHTHVVIEPCFSLDNTEPLDPTKFTFFKGVNGAADNNGIVTANVDKGVPPGVYRLFSINTAANHMPAVASVAQRGSLDDGIYFTAE